jgi:hypothetical protein
VQPDLSSNKSHNVPREPARPFKRAPAKPAPLGSRKTETPAQAPRRRKPFAL